MMVLARARGGFFDSDCARFPEGRRGQHLVWGYGLGTVTIPSGLFASALGKAREEIRD